MSADSSSEFKKERAVELASIAIINDLLMDMVIDTSNWLDQQNDKHNGSKKKNHQARTPSP